MDRDAGRCNVANNRRGCISAFIEARLDCSDSDFSPLTALAATVRGTRNANGSKAFTRPGMQWSGYSTRSGAMKNELFPDRWYGLKLTVFPDAKPQLELNHDPDCSVDPQWFRT